MNPLVWVDIETTGLDPLTGRILEVGFNVTDEELNPLVGPSVLGSVFWLVGPAPSPEDIGMMHPAVQSMHERSGLFADLRDAEEFYAEISPHARIPEIDKIDAAAAHFLSQWDEHGPLIMAGSSVHFDRRWIEMHMPLTAEKFHYRMADVSALREFLSRWLPEHDNVVATVRQDKKHRVMDDLEDSLALARAYRSLVVRSMKENS